MCVTRNDNELADKMSTEATGEVSLNLLHSADLRNFVTYLWGNS